MDICRQHKNVRESSNSFKLTNFLSDVSFVGPTNIIVFILGVFQGLVLPKMLSVEDYGYWKLFLLYIGFSGLMHLGFTDGIYLHWAGQDRDELADDIRNSFRVLLIQLIIIVSVLLLITLNINFNGKKVVILALSCAFVINLTAFSQFTFQAVRSFKIVSVLNLLKPFVFLITVGFLYSTTILRYQHVVVSYIVAGLIVLVIYLYYLRSEIFTAKKSDISFLNNFSKHIQSGWPLLLGNLTVFLILNADLIIIGSLSSINNFAFYAFAITFLGIISIFTNTMSTVIFPHLAKTSNEVKTKAFQLSAAVIILIWGIVLGFYPIVEIFLNNFLPKYSGTLEYIRILILTIALITTIQILHSSYYKLYFEQKKYFMSSLFMLCITFCSLFLTVKFTDDLRIVASVKVLIILFWFVMNEIILRFRTEQSMRDIFKRIASILSFSIIFLISTNIDQVFTRIIFYFFMYFLFIRFFFKDEILTLWRFKNPASL